VEAIDLYQDIMHGEGYNYKDDLVAINETSQIEET
jgi:hypothetical protein